MKLTFLGADGERYTPGSYLTMYMDLTVDIPSIIAPSLSPSR